MTRGKGKPFKRGKGKDRDVRINAAGAPPKSETFAGTLRLLLALDGAGIVAWAGEQAKEFKKLPAGVPLRSLVCLWAIASLSRDFNAATFNAICDRTDGKLGDELEKRLLALEKLAEEKHGNA